MRRYDEYDRMSNRRFDITEMHLLYCIGYD
jgi:hypothetical protein